jgi:dienelactone hydrolase
MADPSLGIAINTGEVQMTKLTQLEPVECRHEGLVLEGRIAIPATPGPHPAIIVVHTAHGLGGHIPDIADRLAAHGYVALAVDMYGGGAYSEDPEVVADLVKPLWGNAARLRSRMGAWLELLKTRTDVIPDRLAALGYCFGGQCVLELARGGGDVRAAISFHGILTTDAPAKPGAVTAKIAVHTGALDPHAPQAHVDDLRAELTVAGADWHISEYGEAYHAFTDPMAHTPETGRAHNRVADEVSWASALALLSIVLNG